MIGSLLVSGVLRPDELSLGIDTTPDGNAIDADGREVPDLFLVGTLRKSTDWESTAVPELRGQAGAVAEKLLGLLMRRRGDRLVPHDGWWSRLVGLRDSYRWAARPARARAPNLAGCRNPRAGPPWSWRGRSIPPPGRGPASRDRPRPAVESCVWAIAPHDHRWRQ